MTYGCNLEYGESDVVKLIVTPTEANSLFRVSAHFLDNLASVEMIEHHRIYLNSKIASEVCFNPKGVIKDQEVIINIIDSNNMFKYSEVNNSNGDIIKQEIVNEQHRLLFSTNKSKKYILEPNNYRYYVKTI